MPSDAEIIEFIVKVENEAKVNALAEAIKLEEANLKKLIATMGSHDAATKASASALLGLNSQLKSAGGSSKSAGQALSQIGYAADDLQYGFKGIANNIQPILSQIPAMAGLAGPISIAAIAANQLYEHWDQIAGLFGQGHAKSQAEEMEELGKKTEKTADETARLLKYEEQRAHVKAQGAKPEAQTEFGKNVDKAIADGPLADIDKGLDKHFGNRIQAMADMDPRNKEIDERIAHTKAGRGRDQFGDRLTEKETQERLDDLQRQKSAIYGEARERFRGDLPNKPDTVKEVQKAAEAHPDDFGPGGAKFAESLKNADPKKAEQARANKAQVDADKKAEQDALDEDFDKADREYKEKKSKQDKRDAQSERMREAEDDAADQVQALNKEDADKREKAGKKAMQGTGLDKRVEDAMLRAALASGGQQGVATAQVAGMISRELQGKGIDAETADKLGKEKAEEHAAKLGDDINDRAMEPAEMRKVEHSGSADFARSVESSGFDQKTADNTAAMKEQLTELVRIAKQGPVLGP
jgi:hypothetical protein